MNMTRRFEPLKSYSLHGLEVTCVSLLEYGRGQLRGVQVATLEAANGTRFKATRWAAGELFRVTPC